MSVEALGWQDEHQLDERRRQRNGFMVSVAIHGLVFAMLAISPARHVPPLPAVLSVDLIGAPPAARVSKSNPKPSAAAPRSAPKPAPKPPTPAEPAPKPPPIAKAPVQVLPENAPKQIRKVDAPKEVPIKPEPRPVRRPREKELSYEDAMAALDDELGPDETPELARAAVEDSSAESAGTPEPRAGVRVSAEMGAWITATTRRIQNNWRGVASYKGRGLVTALEIELSATGQVLGMPRVIVSSGDPFFDDNAVRAVKSVDPLPAPPRAGVTMFNFRSEEY